MTLKPRTHMTEISDFPIRVRSLGTFELDIHGSLVRRWQAGKARNLLQLLLLQRGKPLSKETLYQSLWPEAEWSSSSSSLKVAAHVLRRILTSRSRPEPGSPCLRLVT